MSDGRYTQRQYEDFGGRADDATADTTVGESSDGGRTVVEAE